MLLDNLIINDPNVNPTITPISTLSPFRTWVQQVLPTVYDDSLSYSELLGKVVAQLNTMIEGFNTLNEDFEALDGGFDDLQEYVKDTKDTLVSTYNTLQSFVENYFNNLDVQTEIDNKLDAMAESGALGTIASPYVPAAVTAWLDEHPVETAPPLDRTLSIQDYAADAKAVGDMFDKTMYYRGYASADIDHLVTPGWWTLRSAVDYTTLPTDYVGNTGLLAIWNPGTTADYAVQFLIGSGGQFYLSYVNGTTGRTNTGWVKIAHKTDIPTVDATLRVSGAAADALKTGVNIFGASDAINKAAGINLLDVNAMVHGYYFKSNGTVATTTTPQNGMSGPIKVKASTSYTVYNPQNSFSNNSPYYGIYETPYDFQHPKAIASGTGWNTTNRIFTFTTPDYDCWIRVNCRDTWRGGIVVETALWETIHFPYSGSYEHNVLFGKKIACDGASVMKGNETYDGGYVKMIALINGMSYLNNAAGGATIAQNTSGKHAVCDSLPDVDSGYDYYIFDGASNDHASQNGVTYGTPLDSDDYTTTTFDLTTFTGAFEYICRTLATASKFQGKKVGYVIPHRKYTSAWWVDTWKPFIEATLNKWGIPYLDLEKVIPPIGLVSSLASAYTYNGDGAHPTTECYLKYYVPAITSWLKSL